MNPARPLLAAAAFAALLACKSYQPVTPPAEQARATTFPHSKHGGFDCVDCHTGIPKATRLGEVALPGAAKCQECHEPDPEHTPPAVREPRDHAITFDHAAHLGRIQTKEINDTCKTCHKDELLPEPGPAHTFVPPMQVCTGCHQHQQDVAEARCQPCHTSLRRYPLKPIEALAGLSHQGNWVREHGRVVKNSAATCAQCHDQTYCANCHANATVPFRTEVEFPEKVQADFIHRGDYVSRHQIEASADPASCRKCHGSYFCDSCHTAQSSSHRNFVAGGAFISPHKPGWATKGSGEFHGDAARQNIVTCAGCHDQTGAANVCVTCHNSRGPGAAGLGGNPHPAGYADKHPRSDIRNTPMCLACHTNG